MHSFGIFIISKNKQNLHNAINNFCIQLLCSIQKQNKFFVRLRPRIYYYAKKMNGTKRKFLSKIRHQKVIYCTFGMFTSLIYHLAFVYLRKLKNKFEVFTICCMHTKLLFCAYSN